MEAVRFAGREDVLSQDAATEIELELISRQRSSKAGAVICLVSFALPQPALCGRHMLFRTPLRRLIGRNLEHFRRV
jgi:hypothetical protein